MRLILSFNGSFHFCLILTSLTCSDYSIHLPFICAYRCLQQLWQTTDYRPQFLGEYGWMVAPLWLVHHTHTVHTHKHRQWSSCKSHLLAFCFHGAVSEQAAAAQLPAEPGGRWLSLSESWKTHRPISPVKHEARASWAPRGQHLRQTPYSWLITQNSLLLNRKSDHHTRDWPEISAHI